MKALSQRYFFFLALALMLTLLASCSKDELVEPCGHTSEVGTKANGSTDGADANEANGGPGDSNTEGTDISDDGDDLSGSERNKRKKTN
jgi:hypothetical protein